jgi:hypothetical protein
MTASFFHGDAREAELVMLRHENAVLRRHTGRILLSSLQAPKANAPAERFALTARTEATDRMLIQRPRRNPHRRSYPPELTDCGSPLLHADAEPVLQFVQRGQAALLERRVPELAEDLPPCRALLAEQVSRAGQGILLVLLTHLRLR